MTRSRSPSINGRRTLLRTVGLVFALFALGIVQALETRANDYSIRVIGSPAQAVDFWKEQDFWGAKAHDEDLLVPRIFIVVTSKDWSVEADKLPVAVKKELFYRAAVPLILLANEHVTRDRERLQTLIEHRGKGQRLDAEDMDWLRKLAIHYRIYDPARSGKPHPSDEQVYAMLEELLIRVDIVPPALALGQAAYESGYGTSRFALEGNAFFGQWTWGEKGMRPRQQRRGKGDYKIAAYDWPLDSVRAYIRNLNTQRTYADLRKRRAALRRKGKTLTGHELAGGLSKYSERGQKYVKTLQGIIRTNELFLADKARLGEGPAILLVEANGPAHQVVMEEEIEALRASGELDRIIHSMRLDEAD